MGCCSSAQGHDAKHEMRQRAPYFRETGRKNALSSGSPRAAPCGKRGLRAAICGLPALSLPAADAWKRAAKKQPAKPLRAANSYYSQSKILSSLGVFSVLALLHSGQRSAATPPSIQLSQGEKSIPNLIIFYTENSISNFRELIGLRSQPFPGDRLCPGTHLAP